VNGGLAGASIPWLTPAGLFHTEVLSMRHNPTLFIAFLLLCLGGIHVARGADNPASQDLGKIQPPGGIPLPLVEPGKRQISVQLLNRVKERQESAPAGALDRWVVELERIIGTKLEGELAPLACHTYFAVHMSVAFDDLTWNARTADPLFQRAQSLPAAEARLWEEAFEALLKKEIGQTDTTYAAGGPAYAVPLVLLPVDALHEGQKYSPERGKKYLARLKQLTAEDISLWKEKVDAFGGTELDAAVNVILLDAYFDQEKFQRDRFKAAIEARKSKAQAAKPAPRTEYGFTHGENDNKRGPAVGWERPVPFRLNHGISNPTGSQTSCRVLHLDW
jgi:hypothetical protein